VVADSSLVASCATAVNKEKLNRSVKYETQSIQSDLKLRCQEQRSKTAEILNMQPRLNAEIVIAAIAGFEQQKQHIEAQIVKLRSVLPGGALATTSEANKPRRTQSTAARKIALRQKARRAKIHSLSVPPAAARVEKSMPKRRISEEGLKRIIAATKKRWALKGTEAAKTAKKTALVEKKRPIQKAA
jgi:hypothetical protein